MCLIHKGLLNWQYHFCVVMRFSMCIVLCSFIDFFYIYILTYGSTSIFCYYPRSRIAGSSKLTSDQKNKEIRNTYKAILIIKIYLPERKSQIREM